MSECFESRNHKDPATRAARNRPAAGCGSGCAVCRMWLLELYVLVSVLRVDTWAVMCFIGCCMD